MIARIAIAVVSGTAVTAALLYLMHLGIFSGEGELEARAARVVEFVRVERSLQIQAKPERPSRPAAPQAAPELAPPAAVADYSGAIEIALASPAIDIGGEIDGVRFGASDGEYLPIVKVAPVYPMRALTRRLEGYVLVEFVVTSSGEVRDVTVVESTAEIFEQAAIDAALKFKYKPRVVDGQPIEVAGVRNKISFRLEA